MCYRDSIKSSAQSATTSAKRGTTRVKLKGEMEIIKRKVKTAKQDFGVKVFDLMASNDDAGVASLFAEYRGKIDALERDLQAKRLELQALHPDGSYKVNDSSADYSTATGVGNEDGMTI